MSALLRSLRREDGDILVVAAISMVGLILLGAVVIQVGSWFQDRRDLQVRADAAALAGAALFNECFDSTGFTQANAQTDIENAARQYSGFAGTDRFGSAWTPRNKQFGDGTSSVLFQSKTYPGGGGDGPDDTNTANECDSNNLALDVKLTQDSINGLFSFAPLQTVHAHARVQLKEVAALAPSFPFAVPELDPKGVTVTFVDEAAGTELQNCQGAVIDPPGCAYKLSTTDTTGLGPWLIDATVRIPAGASGATPKRIGMRIGVGQPQAACPPGYAGDGNMFQCFDASTLAHGVSLITSFAQSQPASPPPAIYGVWPLSACGDGGPYISDASVAAGTTTCAVSVNAQADFGTGTVRPTQQLVATVNGTDITLVPDHVVPATPAGSAGWIWTSSCTASIPISSAGTTSEYPVTLAYKIASGSLGCPNAGGSTTNIAGGATMARFTSATDSNDGPIKTVTLSPVADATIPTGGNEYSLAPGLHEMTASVTLGSQFSVPTVLRASHNGSATSLVLCRDDDSPGTPSFDSDGDNQIEGGTVPSLREAFQYGCNIQFQTNSAQLCDSANLAMNPPDCAQNKPASGLGNLIDTALSARFNCGTAGQASNKWPNYSTPGDPRAVTLITTSYSALADNSGNTVYPILGFGAFYIAGWVGQHVTTNQGVTTTDSCGDTWIPALGPPPNNGADAGNVYGYFIKYKNDSGTPSGRKCDVNSRMQCVAVLTR